MTTTMDVFLPFFYVTVFIFQVFAAENLVNDDGSDDLSVRNANPLDYVNALLKKEYGLTVDFDGEQFEVTKDPFINTAQRDSTSSRSTETFSSPNVFYNPVTAEEDVEEEVFNEDIDNASDDPTKLHNLVNKLHKQVKASHTNQVRTRSVLNVIQERQDKQEEDLAILKNEISKVRHEARVNRQVTTALKALVGDNAWAVNDLKSGQKQLSHDYDAMKSIQEQQNATQTRFLDDIARQEYDVTIHTDTLEEMLSDIDDLKKIVKEDRRSTSKLANTIRGKLRDIERGKRLAERTDNNVNATPNREYTTEVPSTSNTEETTALHSELQSLQVQKDKIRDAVQRAEKIDDRAKKRMSEFNGKLSSFEADLTRLQTMYFNLSLIQSQLENQVLRQQQQRSDQEVRDLQQSLVNFTHQIINLEQKHLSNSFHANTSLSNQREVESINQLLDDHSSRLVSAEQMIVDYIEIVSKNVTALKHRVHRIDKTVSEFQAEFSSHDTKARTIFEDVDTMFDELKGDISRNDHRIALVEVKMLNSSLHECQKTNRDHIQDMKISDFDSDITKLDSTVDAHDGRIVRMDRGLSRLYQQVDSQANVVKDIISQMESLTNVIPELNALGSEVENLVYDLPIDCADVYVRLNEPSNGAYLVRPSKSLHSARCFCEFVTKDDEAESWTIVQRRLDGSTSFARTWEEYKKGFGDVNDEFWIGNDNLHYLTAQGDYELQIDMWDRDDVYWFAHYDVFSVDAEGVKYRLRIDGYKGNSTDALQYSSHMPFSTIDMDNDVSSTHCAKFYTAGWWYKHCHYSNLNGRYSVGVVWFNHDTDEWIQLKRSEMKIKAKRYKNQTQ